MPRRRCRQRQPSGHVGIFVGLLWHLWSFTDSCRACGKNRARWGHCLGLREGPTQAARWGRHAFARPIVAAIETPRNSIICRAYESPLPTCNTSAKFRSGIGAALPARAAVPPRQPRWNFHEINQGQTDEDDHHWNVSSLSKHIRSKDGNEEISDRHPSIRRRARPGVAAMRHREPVDSVHGECQARHVKRCRTSENVEPSQSHDEIYASEELAKSGHPETPQPHRAIDLGAGLGIAKESLPTPDEVARAETEKADSDGPKRRNSKCKALRCHRLSLPKDHKLLCLSASQES